MKYGILIVSHVPEIATGILKLLKQVAPDVSITSAGGDEFNGIGSNLEKINTAISKNSENEILAFYDLGSSKMNLEMALDFSDKKIHIYDTAIVESSYVAASLLQANVPLNEIEEQLKELKIK